MGSRTTWYPPCLPIGSPTIKCESKQNKTNKKKTQLYTGTVHSILRTYSALVVHRIRTKLAFQTLELHETRLIANPQRLNTFVRFSVESMREDGERKAKTKALTAIFIRGTASLYRFCCSPPVTTSPQISSNIAIFSPSPPPPTKRG